MSKPRIIKDYEKLTDELLEQLKLVYPKGFRRHLIEFINRDGQKRKGLPFETEDHYYLIRMSAEEAVIYVRDDEDYDSQGNLKAAVKTKIEDKYEDEDFLDELNSNEDNDLGLNDNHLDVEDLVDDQMDDD